MFNLFFCSFQIAKVEKLKPLEVELRRLEDLSESIVNDFAYMKKREEEMRDTNGKCYMEKNKRVQSNICGPCFHSTRKCSVSHVSQSFFPGLVKIVKP